LSSKKCEPNVNQVQKNYHNANFGSQKSKDPKCGKNYWTARVSIAGGNFKRFEGFSALVV